ncbi:MAG TPA: hypothetical protein P5081_23185 [Phycisphaerae bacterium]|mgnify:CR=1 FL=1|nr:hypothetical protein [Phycisphaerae bacterium]HRW55787.1 hypothetical protein [Phycisphaerae bacterium]
MSDSALNNASFDSATPQSGRPSLLGPASIVVGASASIVGLVMLGVFYIGEIVNPSGGLTAPSNLGFVESAAIAFAGVFLFGLALGLTPLIRDRRKDTAAILGVLVNVAGIMSLISLAVMNFICY